MTRDNNIAAAARPGALAAFLARIETAFAAARPAPEARAPLDLVFRRLAAPCPVSVDGAVRLPVVGALDQALGPARAAGGALAALAEAFAALEPQLTWTRRTAGGAHASDGFAEAHANATIVGAAGIERRDDVWIGVSLMQSGTRYPDHSHPPEEVYLAMTPGWFRHGDGDWEEPGTGGTFHNTPGITHAMRAGNGPFLAFWVLPI